MYQGGYKDDYFYGVGELTKKNGTVIKGKFDGDDIEMAHVKNENYEYEGDVVQGKLNGKGRIKFLKSSNMY